MIYGVEIPDRKTGGGYRATMVYIIKDFEPIGRLSVEYGDTKRVIYFKIPGAEQTANLTAIDCGGMWISAVYPADSIGPIDTTIDYYDRKTVGSFIEKFRDQIQKNIDRQIHVFY